jgi:beta-phosphoglucomutase-like phosphatase (HAD superfamily)
MVPSPKPAPDVYLLAAERLGVQPSQTLVFEDSAPGVGAGVAAGAVTVAVPCPATQAHDLSAAHARFASFEELGGAELGALIGRFFGAA